MSGCHVWTCKIKLSQVRLGYIMYGQIKTYRGKKGYVKLG